MSLKVKAFAGASQYTQNAVLAARQDAFGGLFTTSK
jgi:hypothetical protein